MKKLLVIGVLMSVMLVGCGTQKETTAVEDSTVSNVVAEAVTEVLTETAETIEETTTAIEETTVAEETTTVEETTEEVVEETTETETVVEETTEVVEEPAPVEEVPAPVAEVPAEEPAPEVAPATTGTTVTVTALTGDGVDIWYPIIKDALSNAGYTLVSQNPIDQWWVSYTIEVNSTDDLSAVKQVFMNAGTEVQ